MSAVPKCRTVTVHLFRGSRGALGQRVRRALDDQLHGWGPGPALLECLLYAGHTGISVDSQPAIIWGFNPDSGSAPLWLVMQNLRNGNAYPGVVKDDTNVFTTAKSQRLRVLTFQVALPGPAFRVIDQQLANERKKSQFTYGFPDGDGDCNCATWLERLGLPLLRAAKTKGSDPLNSRGLTPLF